MMIYVAMAFNDAYAKYASVSMLSILANNKKEDIVHFFVLHSDINENNQKILNRLIEENGGETEFIYIDKNQFPSRLPFHEKITIETYFRLFLAEKLPIKVTRVIYLDVDTIVNKSLRDYFELEFEGNLICGCEDVCTLSENDIRRNQFADIFKSGYKYICAGSILLNLEELRPRYTFEYYMKVAEQLEFNLVAHDQDLINYVHYNKIKLIDKYEYNLASRFAYVEGIDYEKARTKTVVHFFGPKPWQGGNHIHYNTELLWWEYAKGSPYYMELVESYIESSLTDIYVSSQMEEILSSRIMLEKENKTLKEEIELRKQLNEKLLKLVEDNNDQYNNSLL